MRDRRTAFCYDHPRPALTADAVVLRSAGGVADRNLEILLIQRGNHPFAGHWALPGGFVDRGESPEEAARRELCEETGLSAGELTQVGAFGDPGRDPRGWVVSVAYVVRLKTTSNVAVAGDDASKVRWWPANRLPPLAFDHARIVEMALRLAASEASTFDQAPAEPLK
jgi:8-oxo-dGTP diphosphatase